MPAILEEEGEVSQEQFPQVVASFDCRRDCKEYLDRQSLCKLGAVVVGMHDASSVDEEGTLPNSWKVVLHFELDPNRSSTTARLPNNFAPPIKNPVDTTSVLTSFSDGPFWST